MSNAQSIQRQQRYLVTSPCCPRCGEDTYDYLGEGKCTCRVCQFEWIGITSTRAAQRQRERALTAAEIRTAPIGADLPADTLPLLITRYWPRGHRRGEFCAWWRELAPPAPLLKAFRSHALDWDAFATGFEEHLWEQIDRDRYRRRIRDLLEHAAATSVTLQCFERDAAGEAAVHCHRRIVKLWLLGGVATAETQEGRTPCEEV